jgi:hypothetical protein
MDEFNKCEKRFCRTQAKKMKKFSKTKTKKKSKNYKCSAKEKNTRLPQHLLSHFPLLSQVRLPISQSEPKTLCEKKQRFLRAKQIRADLLLYVEPWQQCLRKNKCKM